MYRVTVDTKTYIDGMFQLFKNSSSGILVEQIMKEYEKNPNDASIRDAWNLSQIMYYNLK